MDWRDYEQQIFDALLKQFPDANLVCDTRLDGRISGIKRQIDILAHGRLMDKRPFAVIDCKFFSREVDITVVEAFLGLLADVGAHIGVLITNSGYTDAAQSRARNDQTRDLRLHIVQASEISTLPTYRLVYFGSLGIRFAIPPDWDITNGNDRTPGMISWDLLPRSTSRDAAYRMPRWAYLALVPVIGKSIDQMALELFNNQHTVSLQRGIPQYRAERWGTGDITYRRLLTPQEVEISAMIAADTTIAVIELHTTHEHATSDEEMLVTMARSIAFVNLDNLNPSESPQEAWISEIHQHFNSNTKPESNRAMAVKHPQKPPSKSARKK